MDNNGDVGVSLVEGKREREREREKNDTSSESNQSKHWNSAK